MSGAQYRFWIDRQPAPRALYDRLETITVEQAMGMASEARLEFEACVDDKGIWKSGPSDPIARGWHRIRIEVKRADGRWIPLIEGPVGAWNASMSSEPGRSMLTVTVYDDGKLLNRRSPNMDVKWEGKSDRDIALSLLRDYDVTIADIPSAPADIPLQLMQYGSPMEILMDIADRNGLELFVKPGTEEGKSSHVHLVHLAPSQLPLYPKKLVLVGPKRNIDSFDVRSDAMKGRKFASSRLNLRDMAVETHTSSWQNVDLLDDKSAVDDPEQLDFDMVDPVDAAAYDGIATAQWNQQWVSYQLHAAGTVRSSCFDGVLEPYTKIRVVGVDPKVSTKYLVTEVTHTLARSTYEQSFTLIGNGIAELDENGFPKARTPGVGISLP